MGQQTRLKQLDVLRAIAVLLVLGSHKQTLALWMSMGWIGVDLFFVLSGFLVSGLLFTEYQKHGKVRIKRFLIRRGFKIYPPFYTLWFTTIFLVTVVAGSKIPRGVLISESLFVQNYGPAFWGHTWSLAVEEHFYLLLAAGIFFLLRNAKRGINPFVYVPRITLFVGVLLLVLRVLTSIYVVPFSLKTHQYPTHLRLDSLLFGVLLSYYHHFHHEAFSASIKRYWKLIGTGSCLMISSCLLVDQSSFFMSTIGYTLLYLGFGGILLVSFYSCFSVPRLFQRFWNLVGTSLAFIGVHSYSIYLWHLPVANWGFMAFHHFFRPLNYKLEFLFYLLTSLGVGVLMAKLVERPSLWIRELFYPSRINPVSTPGPSQPDMVPAPEVS
jgi:peptidoglycan/LPS O-acetylase OafA/YrhL